MRKRRKMTRDDLDILGLSAEKLWREHRPNAVKAMEASGTLYDALKEAEKSTVKMLCDLVAQKVDPYVAQQQAMREYIQIPDHGEEPTDPQA
jgi:hypothetical protein